MLLEQVYLYFIYILFIELAIVTVVAVTLFVALVVTILFSYDEMIKFSNSKGFLLATV